MSLQRQIKSTLEDTPLVSIIVISYNHEYYVEECLESVFKQTYKNIEIIVIDNGSNDQSIKKIELFQKKYKFLFIKNKQTQLVPSLKNISDIVKGSYISIISADDFWESIFVEHMASILSKDKDIGACSGKVKLINETGRILSIPGPQKDKNYIFNDFFLERAYFPAPASMIRRSALDEIGWYNQSYGLEDIPTWFAISSKEWKMVFTSKIVGSYRRHSSNMSKSNPANHRLIKKR